MGRLETAARRKTSRSSGEVVLQWPERQLSIALLTLMAAMAAELKVGLMARTVSPPAGGDRLLTLRCSRARIRLSHRMAARYPARSDLGQRAGRVAVARQYSGSLTLAAAKPVKTG